MPSWTTLPRLGLGVSTEWGATGLDPLELRRVHPQFAELLEVGVETAKGLDAPTRRWVEAGGATTYHFLDHNLNEPEDLDERWLDEVHELVSVLRPAWMCGDAGLWHLGGRERGHFLLLPPVLTVDGARRYAAGIAALSEAVGLVVLPENPPGTAYVGDLHVLDFYARVCEEADTGMLLDLAHLVIYQDLAGLPPEAGLDAFPLDRIVEIHVAGGVYHDTPLRRITDAHGPALLPQTWALAERLLPRCPNLRAVVFECERNALPDVLPTFTRLRRLWP